MTILSGLAADAVADLRTRLRGGVLTASDTEYDAARAIWNGMIDKRPSIIARCAGVADVIEAVKFGRKHDLLIAIRGGGHSAAGLALCDEGLVIDLTGMKGARVDPGARTVQAQAGMVWSELDVETQAFGLAVTGGTVSNTGVSGLTVGGGLGWLMGKHGLSCDNVLSIDLVTADGVLITASDTEHPELFWALRGGGGNFGVVTSFTFRLFEVGPVLGGMVIHPMSAAGPLLRFYRDFSATLPDEAEAYAGLLTSPDGQPVVAVLLGYNGDLTEGERVLAPMRQFGSPVADLVQPMSYVQRQHLLDEVGVYGVRRYWKSGFTQDLNDDFLDLVIERARTLPSPLTQVLFFNMHGAATRVEPQATAFGLRDSQWDFDVLSQWTNPAEDAVHVQWTREFWRAVESNMSGVYVNHIAGDEPERVTAAYGPNHARLVEAKTQYDPNNVFRVNHNIRPRSDLPQPT